MDAVVGSLRVDLGLETAQFTKGVKHAQTATQELLGHLKTFALEIAAAFTFEKIIEGFSAVVEGMETLSHTAQKIGIPVEELSKLKFAADLTHVGIDNLSTGIERFSKNLELVAGGKGGNAALALQAIGVSAVDARGKLKPTNDLILEISGRFAGMKDGAGKTAIAMALFGKTGAELIPMLNRGADGLREMEGTATKLGLAFNDKAAQAAERFEENLMTLQDGVKGLAQQVAIALLPSLVNLTNSFTDFVSAGDFARRFVEGMKVEFGDFQRTIIVVTASLETLGAVGQALKKDFDDLMSGNLIENTHNWTEAADNIAHAWAIADKQIKMTLQTVNEGDKGDLPRKQIEAPNFTALADSAKDAADKIKHHLTPALKELKPALTAAQETMKEVAGIFSGAFSTAFSSLIDGTSSVKKAFANMAQSILSNLASMMANKLFTGLFGSLFGGALGGGIPATFNGLYADGGTIPSGKWGVVGEGGGWDHAEVVAGPATVIPMNKIGSGGQNINYSPVFNIQGADGPQVAMLREEVRKQSREFAMNVRKVVSGEKSLNPRFAT